MLTLSIALGSYGHTRALKDGSVQIPNVEANFIAVDPMISAYRRMIRNLEFDVCEMSATTYLVASAHRVPITAIPVFLTRIFHHDAVVVRGDAGITHPKQLEGRRVGVRAYTVTTGVWTRGLLQHEYGVDPAKVTWVTDDEEHVETFKPPPNVISAPVGRSLADLFQAGELDAAFTGNAGIGRAGPPREGWSREAPARPPSGAEGPRPLFADADERDRAWYQATGISPIHALVVVQDRLLVEHPRLATDLYVAFCEAKQARDPSTVDERWEKLVPIVGSDPLPYGVAANRTSLEALSAYACEQAIVPRAFDPRELLAAGTLET